MTTRDFLLTRPPGAVGRGAASLCIACLRTGVFAQGVQPCVKEQTGGEEKLPSEFNQTLFPFNPLQ